MARRTSAGTKQQIAGGIKQKASRVKRKARAKRSFISRLKFW